MNTAEISTLSLALLAGGLIGAIFFGGLWWTVQYGLKARRPVLLFISSLIARFGLALLGFYFVGGAHLERLAACLVGFIVSRVVIGRILQRSKSDFDSCPSARLRAKQGAPILRHSNTPSLQQPRAEHEDDDEDEYDKQAPVERGGSPCI